MKTITLHKPLNIDSIYNHLAQNLNPLFNKHKPTIYKYTVEKTGNTIDITQQELYPGDHGFIRFLGFTGYKFEQYQAS